MGGFPEEVSFLGLNWMTTLVNPFFRGCGKNHKKYLGWSWIGLNDSHYTHYTSST